MSRNHQNGYLSAFLLGTALTFALTFPGTMAAQDRDRDHGRSAQDRDRDHGRSADRDRRDENHAWDSRDRVDQRSEYHFRPEDRDRFVPHYRARVDGIRRHPERRHHLYAGERIPRGYYVAPVPRAYYREMPLPPPGYRLGYYDGYVVAYDPTTRIIADVLDLVNAGLRH